MTRARLFLILFGISYAAALLIEYFFHAEPLSVGLFSVALGFSLIPWLLSSVPLLFQKSPPAVWPSALIWIGVMGLVLIGSLPLLQ